MGVKIGDGESGAAGPDEGLGYGGADSWLGDGMSIDYSFRNCDIYG